MNLEEHVAKEPEDGGAVDIHCEGGGGVRERGRGLLDGGRATRQPALHRAASTVGPALARLERDTYARAVGQPSDERRNGEQACTRTREGGVYAYARARLSNAGLATAAPRVRVHTHTHTHTPRQSSWQRRRGRRWQEAARWRGRGRRRRGEGRGGRGRRSRRRGAARRASSCTRSGWSARTWVRMRSRARRGGR